MFENPSWLALIRRKDGATVDSFEETLETCIILEPYNLDSSIDLFNKGSLPVMFVSR